MLRHAADNGRLCPDLWTRLGYVRRALGLAGVVGQRTDEAPSIPRRGTPATLAMMRLMPVAIALACVFALPSRETFATEWIVVSLPSRVESSDAIVIARVVDADRGVVAVGRPPQGG